MINTVAPFPTDPVQTAIAIAYHNRRLIADAVLPRVVVGRQEFKYQKHEMSQGFTIPDTKVGRRSQPNEVSFTGSEETGATQDYGLDDPIPMVDLLNAPDGYDVQGKSTEFLTNLIELDREVRVAELMQSNDSYASNNISVLDSTTQFNQANSDPIALIGDILDSAIMRPTIMTIGRKGYSALARNPNILKAVHGNSGDKGIATRQAIADLFELEDIYIGDAFVNTARKGEAVNMQRTWGDNMMLIYRDQLATADRGTTFGFTAQFGDRVAGSKDDDSIGLRGGLRNRVGESVAEVISAPDLGFLVKNIIG